jgi:hypothetical protein
MIQYHVKRGYFDNRRMITLAALRKKKNSLSIIKCEAFYFVPLWLKKAAQSDASNKILMTGIKTVLNDRFARQFPP